MSSEFDKGGTGFKDDGGVKLVDGLKKRVAEVVLYEEGGREGLFMEVKGSLLGTTASESVIDKDRGGKWRGFYEAGNGVRVEESWGLGRVAEEGEEEEEEEEGWGGGGYVTELYGPSGGGKTRVAIRWMISCLLRETGGRGWYVQMGGGKNKAGIGRTVEGIVNDMGLGGATRKDVLGRIRFVERGEELGAEVGEQGYESAASGDVVVVDDVYSGFMKDMIGQQHNNDSKREVMMKLNRLGLCLKRAANGRGARCLVVNQQLKNGGPAMGQFWRGQCRVRGKVRGGEVVVEKGGKRRKLDTAMGGAEGGAGAGTAEKEREKEMVVL